MPYSAYATIVHGAIVWFRMCYHESRVVERKSAVGNALLYALGLVESSTWHELTQVPIAEGKHGGGFCKDLAGRNHDQDLKHLDLL